MTTSPLTEALARTERQLFRMQVLESFIARRESGENDAEDAETASALARELTSHQSSDGSWGGNLGLTAENLLLFAALRPFAEDISDSLVRAVAWLRTRQRAPGTYPGVCSPEQHRTGTCKHFAGGFFSPGPVAVSFAGATLSSGASFPTDDDARLGLSAVALRSLLEYQPVSIDDTLQIDAMLRLTDMMFRDGSSISLPACVAVLCALARAPRSAGTMTTIHGAFSRLSGKQRADGSWPGAEGFHVADAFLVAIQAGYGSPLFDRAIVRTAETLLLSQQPDGTWGHSAGPHRMLIAWRTLRFAAGVRSL